MYRRTREGGGLDYFVTLEGRVRNPGFVIDASAAEIAEWCLKRQPADRLPLSVGSGNSDMSAKYDALITLKLRSRHRPGVRISLTAWLDQMQGLGFGHDEGCRVWGWA